jgi:hypothetical protein
MSSVHRTVAGELLVAFRSGLRGGTMWQWSRNTARGVIYSREFYATQAEAMEGAMEALRAG